MVRVLALLLWSACWWPDARASEAAPSPPWTVQEPCPRSGRTVAERTRARRRLGVGLMATGIAAGPRGVAVLGRF